MGFAELGRVALEVQDIDACAADLDRILGMQLEVHNRAADTLGLRAGTGRHGVELVQRTIPDPPPARYWNGALAALILAVDDLEEAFVRMHDAGFTPVHTIVTDTGFRELFYGDSFHGIPLVFYEKGEADLLHGPKTGDFELDEHPVGAPAARTAMQVGSSGDDDVPTQQPSEA
jgi:catechol 2,3-dioxygenase-like lactoylglutathione lyase family enzyme